MEIEVKATQFLEEGKHTGKITEVSYRTDPYEYTDIYIKVEGKEITLKHGCPTLITTNSSLGKLLQVFGAEIVPGQKIDPEKILIGKEVTFMTINKETDKGTFSNIISGTIKPEAEKSASPNIDGV